jgi:FdhD protein
MFGPDETSERLECVVVRAGVAAPAARDVIREQPLRIVVNGSPAATLMCTPGAEPDLAVGFLLTEGLIGKRADILTMAFCPDRSVAGGVVHVRLAERVALGAKPRYRDVFSSCSLCGIEVIEAFSEGLPGFRKPVERLRPEDLFRLRDVMEAEQSLFRKTGGSHAAALGFMPLGGSESPAIVREDLGRHNALDKAVGAALQLELSLDRALVLLSGRLSLEMVAKAARAGISDVAGVSAPTAAGVALARKLGMFLAGFVRGDTMTVYSGAEALATHEGA